MKFLSWFSCGEKPNSIVEPLFVCREYFYKIGNSEAEYSIMFLKDLPLRASIELIRKTKEHIRADGEPKVMSSDYIDLEKNESTIVIVRQNTITI